jgi:hypothetical protein
MNCSHKLYVLPIDLKNMLISHNFSYKLVILVKRQNQLRTFALCLQLSVLAEPLSRGVSKLIGSHKISNRTIIYQILYKNLNK